MTSSDEHKKIAEEAHAWQVLISEGPLSPLEQVKFVSWIDASPEHRQAFERAKLLWAEMSSVRVAELDPALARPLLRERVIEAAKFTTVPAAYLRHPATGFAGVMLAALLVFFLTPWGFEPVGAPSPAQHRTGVAEVKEIKLGDGSTVALGAMTALSATLNEDQRSIELRQGEAMFDVAPDPDRPFTVVSGSVKAQAVGTSFLVSKGTDRVQIAVAEGIVDVAPADPEQTLRANGSNTPVRLNVGEQVTASTHAGLAAVSEIDVGTLGAWRTGRLIYVDTPLSQVVADANRYTERRIIITDEGVADLTINAAFNSDNIDAMLTTLAEALPITLRHYADAVYVEAATPDLLKSAH